MAKILFISDNFINESLGIMCLSSYLKANGHEVEFTLLSQYKNINSLFMFIKDISPDLVGFSVMTPQVDTFDPISKAIKDATGCTVIWGGVHCMLMLDEVLRSGCADIICVGEGEEPLLMLMDRIDAHKEFEGIPNLWIRRKDRWIKNELGNLEPNLDKYPYPDRDLYYNKYKFLHDFALKRLTTQRGCPHNCSYCFQSTYKEMYKGKGELIRQHSVEYVINEIKSIISKYPVRTIHFSDDTFNSNKTWVADFLLKYKKEICLSFTCNISPIGVDEKMVQELKEAGCIGITFGLECGDEDVRLNILNKKIPNKNYTAISSLLHEHGLRFMVNIMCGLPNESLDDAVKSISFAQSLKPYGIRVSALKIYKGTKLAEFITESNLYEGVGKFTYKCKDIHKDYSSIKNMVWVGYLFIKLPFLLRFSKNILAAPAWVMRLLKPILLYSHWQEAKFFKIPLLQSLRYFLYSREVFTKGILAEQVDVYEKIKVDST